MTNGTGAPGGEPALGRWGAGVVSGLVAGVGMGLVLLGTDFFLIVGLLVGLPGQLGGWVVHLLVSVAFALLFVQIVSQPLLSDYTSPRGGLVGLGVGMGAFLGLVTGGIVLPVAVDVAGSGDLPVPLLPGLGGGVLFPLRLGIAHLVYGLLLGAVYQLLVGAPRESGLAVGGA